MITDILVLLAAIWIVSCGIVHILFGPKHVKKMNKWLTRKLNRFGEFVLKSVRDLFLWLLGRLWHGIRLLWRRAFS